ncbi:AfsR/SARP family transcriptional regulator [Amycolatopsis vastitatis]|uniref:Transcriptional regulator, SARP family protein n=1 Tax=Amycolatopsis vastitatis TaxID=1905142 RepID=A0A229TB52_9PSEU|nr:BTAD domain-containing putative transcriptional regulator [Amycolatopsis vastitatis]OXM68496.1 transcriptional regulator, SARP family protein [Amycolatopsis vastitatis]
MDVDFRLLGTVEARIGDRLVDLGPARQRCVLVALLLEANRVVLWDQLVDRVWGESPPHRVRSTLPSYVSRLRKALSGADQVSIAQQVGGYMVVLPDAAIDLHRFRKLTVDARAAGDEIALRLFEQAFDLWQMPDAFAGLETAWLTAARGVLAQERFAARLDYFDVALRCGRHAALLPELTALGKERPSDERLAGQLILALYRSGRQAEALGNYEQCRLRLADELGADPSPPLQELHRKILAADPLLLGSAELGFANPRHPVAPVRAAAGVVPVPRQLPLPPGRFTGRAAELAELGAVLGGSGPAVAALSGAGGIGKTSLALHWAHGNAHRFPDGELFADLQGFGPNGPPVDPQVVVTGFLRALGVAPDDVPVDPSARQGLYRSLLADRRVLVVLDNASDTAQVSPLLPGAGACAVVVTSRRVLTGLVTGCGAHHLALQPLPDDQARELLERHLGRPRPAAEPVATGELIKLCGGFPLALAVFAARAAANPRVSLAAFAAELCDLGLDALEDDDAAASLPAVLSWSCRALTDEERFVFALLGIAPGPDIDLTAVVNLTALTPARARKALRGLTDASLVTRNARDRYAMHDLVRQYAATCLPGTPEAALRRLVDFHLATGFAADRLLAPHRPVPRRFSVATPHHPAPPADATAALAWFDDEHPCLLADQRVALERGWHDVVWRLAWLLNTYTYRRGHLPHRIASWEAALAVADCLDDEERADVYRYVGNAYVSTQRVEEAVRHLYHALELAERRSDPVATAVAHHDLAGVYERRNDDRRALEHATRALALFRTLGNPVWEAFALNDAGWYAARVGDHDAARRHCGEALELHRRHGNHVGEAATLDSLGYSHHRTGGHGRAVEYYREALHLYRDLDHQFQVAQTLDKLGDAYAAAGADGRAREVWQGALELYCAQHRSLEANRLRARLQRGELRGSAR